MFGMLIMMVNQGNTTYNPVTSNLKLGFYSGMTLPTNNGDFPLE